VLDEAVAAPAEREVNVVAWTMPCTAWPPWTHGKRPLSKCDFRGLSIEETATALELSAFEREERLDRGEDMDPAVSRSLAVPENH